MKTRKGNKVYQLTSAQKLHYYSMKYCPKKQVLNIGTGMTIQVELERDKLEESIREAIARCECLRVQFTEDKEGNVYQYVAKDQEPVIRHFDFGHWKEEDAHDLMTEWTSTPFELYDSPMYEIVMIRMPEDFYGLYVKVNHLIMDAQALIAFMKDVMEIYSGKVLQDIPFPKDMSSYVKQLEKDLAYEAGSNSSQKDREFFQNLIASSEPIFTDIYGTAKLEAERKRTGNPNQRAVINTSDNVDANLASFYLEEDAANDLMKFCEEQHVSLTCLLLMGLRTYLQKENGIDDVSISTTIARRATLMEKRCGGTRIHSFPFRTIVSREDTFLEALYKIRDMQNQYFRHANYSPAEYYAYRKQYYNLENGQTYEPLALTYQPVLMKYSNEAMDKMDDIQYNVRRYTNGACAHTLYLTVSHRPMGGLDFCFEHQTGVVTYEKLQEVYFYLCRIMFHGIEDCSRTVGEIIDWS
ncbi:MAG: peptide synthetase [Lachnospiraceae bacterium]|nr:peptide synthetase [Lachnospiraceae bacterium]